MLLRETGFKFGGLHSRDDFGLIYAEKDGHPILPKINRNEYTIAGASGSVLYPGEERQLLTFEGTLYPARERRTQAQAQVLLRMVARWLSQGRRQLIFDYEPELYYMAEMSIDSKWSLKNWFGGEISVKFEAQPYAYSVSTQNFATFRMDDDPAVLTLDVETIYPAGVSILIEPLGTAPVTAVSIQYNGLTFASFSGLELEAGQTLRVDMETPIGAVIDTGSGTVNALPCADVFWPVLVEPGESTVVVTPTYGEGTPGVDVTVSTRGRW